MESEEILRGAIHRVATRVRFLRTQYYGLRLLFYGTVLSLIPLLLKGLIAFPAWAPVVVVAAGAALCGAVYGLLLPIRPADAAQVADRAMRLKDRLATALEVLEVPAPSPIQKALVADAVCVAGSLNPKAAVRRLWPREALFFPPVALALGLLVWLPPLPLPAGGVPIFGQSSTTPPEETTSPRPGQAIQEKRVERKAKMADWVESQEREIQRRPSPQEQARGDLAAIFKDTSISQKRPDFSSFLKQGDERLRLLERTETLPDLKRDFTQSRYRVMFRRMQGLTGGLRPDQLSPEKLRQLLEEMQRLGRRGGGEGGNPEYYDEMGGMDQGQMSRELNAIEKALNRLRSMEEAEKGGRKLKGGREQPGRRGPGRDEGSGRGQFDGENDFGDGESLLPGKGHSPNLRGDPSPRIGTRKLDVGVEGQPRRGRREAYDTNLLGPGSQNPSQLPYMNVYSQYRKMMEDALAKENIPLDYRAQVKEYFRSLGER